MKIKQSVWLVLPLAAIHDLRFVRKMGGVCFTIFRQNYFFVRSIERILFISCFMSLLSSVKLSFVSLSSLLMRLLSSF